MPHSNSFKLALKHFPMGMLFLTTCFACAGSARLYHFFRHNEEVGPILQIQFTTAIIGILPFLLLYVITLIRLPTIRRNMQLIAEITPEESSWDRAEIVAEEKAQSGVAYINIEKHITIEIIENN